MKQQIAPSSKGLLPLEDYRLRISCESIKSNEKAINVSDWEMATGHYRDHSSWVINAFCTDFNWWMIITESNKIQLYDFITVGNACWVKLPTRQFLGSSHNFVPKMCLVFWQTHWIRFYSSSRQGPPFFGQNLKCILKEFVAGLSLP